MNDIKKLLEEATGYEIDENGNLIDWLSSDNFRHITLHKEQIAKLEALIQEQVRQTQVKCAAELSILDQEITSLKAQIKELKNE